MFNLLDTKTVIELQEKIGIELYNKKDHHLLAFGFLIGLSSAEKVVYHIGKPSTTLKP